MYKRQFVEVPAPRCTCISLTEEAKSGRLTQNTVWLLSLIHISHPAKFKDTVEKIIGEAVEIPAKLQAFMRGEKKRCV